MYLKLIQTPESNLASLFSHLSLSICFRVYKTDLLTLLLKIIVILFVKLLENHMVQ